MPTALKRALDPNRYPRKRPKPPAPLPRATFPTAFDTASHLAFPEPGTLIRGLVQLFGNKVSARAILNWRSGKSCAPQWAIDQLQSYLQNIANKTSQAAADLDKEKAGH